MKFKELKSKNEQELRVTLLELRQKAHDMAVRIRLNQHPKNSQLSGLRRDIARVLTLLKQNGFKQ